MSGHFKVKAKTKLADLPIGYEIQTSDFATLTPDGTFVQLEHIEEEEEVKPYDVKPGIWSMQKTMTGMKLEATSFVEDDLLESFISTKNITDKIDCFFERLHVYRKHGFAVPKRGMLLYGPAGTGKTTAALLASRKYGSDGKTAILVWGTDKIDPVEVKDFVKIFRYVGVEKVILVMEDIGGVEIDQVRIKSTASLLSLLDNQEKIFTIPIFVLATTNHPEAFLGNLTNRPGRFDDKIEVTYPPTEQRIQLLKFFNKNDISEEVLEKFRHKKYGEFSPAHIREIIIRSELHDMTLGDSMESIQKEIEHYKNMFQKKNKLGIIDDDNGPY
jgi:SpoVK/Ycf46/Vps4 family AAA+-type ATPase